MKMGKEGGAKNERKQERKKYRRMGGSELNIYRMNA
jgi:hypothetical protein